MILTDPEFRDRFYELAEAKLRDSVTVSKNINFDSSEEVIRNLEEHDYKELDNTSDSVEEAEVETLDASVDFKSDEE